MYPEGNSVTKILLDGRNQLLRVWKFVGAGVKDSVTIADFPIVVDFNLRNCKSIVMDVLSEIKNSGFVDVGLVPRTNQSYVLSALLTLITLRRVRWVYKLNQLLKVLQGEQTRVYLGL